MKKESELQLGMDMTSEEDEKREQREALDSIEDSDAPPALEKPLDVYINPDGTLQDLSPKGKKQQKKFSELMDKRTRDIVKETMEADRKKYESLHKSEE